MRIAFSVTGVPPKKDGANSMWRKGPEVVRLKTLRAAALEALGSRDIPVGSVRLTLTLWADRRAGDLDNFITGIYDGLMAAHAGTPIDDSLWADVPAGAQPGRQVALQDDSWVSSITAERFASDLTGQRYEVTIEWAE